MVTDIQAFLIEKNNENNKILNQNILTLFYELFGDVDKRKKTKKSLNILKTHKLQNMKDNISNRVNLILNKMSELNLDNLIIEFIDNIRQVNIEEYKEIQKTIYLKILSEINFINIYLSFLKIISGVYQNVQKYNINYFYELMENKFKYDYLEIDAEEFIRNLEGENKRINNLILIKSLVDNNMLSAKIFNECDNIILNQNKYIVDIYHWFNINKRDLAPKEISKIKELISFTTQTREKVLLSNLINNEEVINSEVKKQVVIKKDTFKLEIDNIIDECLLLGDTEDIKTFISSRCIDAVQKNKFSESLMNKYFISGQEDRDNICELIKELIKEQVLFKSNLSRGLLLLLNNWEEYLIDYDNSETKLKILLGLFKNMGITKGLESYLDKYKLLSDTK